MTKEQNSDSDRASTSQPREGRETRSKPNWAERSQAWAAIAAVVISLAAALAATAGLIVQVNANSQQARAIQDQLISNDLDRRAEVSKYARAVSWYYDLDTVKIQNRSPIPIVELRFSIQAYPRDTNIDSSQGSPSLYTAVELPSLAPCTTMDFKIDPGTRDRLNSIGYPIIRYSSIFFADLYGRWSITHGGTPQAVDLRARDATNSSPSREDFRDINAPPGTLPPAPDRTQTIPTRYETEPASDCGT